jgi:hypothetical protein
MRYKNSEILKSKTGKNYLASTIYPKIKPNDNDLYIISEGGDRLDLLSYQYYKDPTLWWIISVANNNITFGSMFPEPGTQLRIPTNLTNVITLFNDENQQ